MSTSSNNASPVFPTTIASLDCRNGTVIPTVQGLNYTVYCGYDIVSHNLDDSIQETFEACLEDCTTRGPLCIGVVWYASENRCYRKDKDSSTNDLKIGTSIVALASTSQLKQPMDNIVCPAPNLSIQRSRSGREYKIRCGAWYGGSENAIDWRHVRTMDECMEHCDGLHPLCSRVNLNSDFIGTGWLNCELKNASAVKPSWYTRTMGHSAEAEAITLPEEPCEHDATRTAGDGRKFKVSCNDQRVLNDTAVPPVRTLHAPSLGHCIQHCTGTNFTCNTAMFDVSLHSGYQNCYLFEGLPPPGERNRDYTLTYLETMSAQYQPPPPEPQVEKRDWIAGAVLGPVIACGLLALIYWYYVYRPKRKTKAS